MDGSSNLLGRRTITQKFNGREYRFSIGTLANHAEKEQYILALKPSPFTALEKLPATVSDSIQEALLNKAMAEATKPQYVSMIEEAEFDNSLHGLAYGLWRALRENEFDFGKLKADEQPVYEHNGVGYSLAPRDGVQKTLDLIEAIGSQHHNRLVDIRDGVESPPELKN